MSICEKTPTLIFLDLQLVQHFVNRKLVTQSQYISQANPTAANFILHLLVTDHVLSTAGSISLSQSYITTGSQSASPSWCQAPIWDPRPICSILALIIFRHLRVCSCRAPSLTRRRICNLQCNDASSISSCIATDVCRPVRLGTRPLMGLMTRF
jgi:hypothetical protein